MKIKNFGITLLELLISIIIFGILSTGIVSFSTLVHNHVYSAQMRSEVQHELSITLADMSKTVYMATGSVNDMDAAGNPLPPPVCYYPIGSLPPNVKGFQVRVDENNTPDNPLDDTLYTYKWANHQIKKGTSTVRNHAHINWEPLNSRPVVLDDVTFAPEALGYQFIIPNDPETNKPITNGIEIILTGRYHPGTVESPRNPQVTLSTRAYSHSVSTR